MKGTSGIRNKIEFWDSLSNSRIKTIHLADLNPYKYINGNVIGILPDFETPIYSPDLGKEGLIPVNTNEPTIDSGSYKILIRFTTSRNSQNHIGIIYSKYTMYNERIKVVQSHIKVLNKKGDIVYESGNLDTDGFAPVITSDGKYILFMTGEDRGEGNISSSPQGFIICDVMNERAIYQSTKGRYIGANVIDGRLFMIANNHNKGFVEYQIFDCAANVSYTKAMEDELSSNIKEVNATGMLIEDQKNGNKTFLQFKKDFLTYSIEEK
ncbi:MAG: hypothetical protein ACKVU0_02715 [Saprospiraceae bacterium]